MRTGASSCFTSSLIQPRDDGVLRTVPQSACSSPLEMAQLRDPHVLRDARDGPAQFAKAGLASCKLPEDFALPLPGQDAHGRMTLLQRSCTGAILTHRSVFMVCPSRTSLTVLSGSLVICRVRPTGLPRSSSTMDGSSFSGLLTRVEIGHIRIRPARNCRIRSCGSGSSLSQRAQSLGANDDRHAVMDLGNQLIGISGDDYESP